MIDYATILDRRFKVSSWTLAGDEYEGLTWLSDSPKPSKAELDALWLEVKAEVKAEAQARVDARVSALDKLVALGLSEAEIKALLG